MKKLKIITLISILALTPLYSNPKELTIPQIASSIEEFIEFRDQTAKTPEGGAVVTLHALMAFSQSRELGMQYLTIALDSNNLSKGDTYKGFTPNNSIMYHISRFDRSNLWEFTPFAYVQGAKPESGYKTNIPFKILVSRNKFSGDESTGEVKVFVHVYGVSPRPVKMKKNDRGIWKAKELSSLFLTVQAPPSSQSDDL